ncbi:MAG: serine/threonine-protein kinase, partial [Planctomycetota bacterium]
MVLGGGSAGAEQLARFQAEGQAIASLQHANIVQIYEVGQHDSLPYFSLEYVDGGSLDKTLKGQPQPPLAAAQLTETLARAMQRAHDIGIVHRDLKPGNILLTRDGTPKITDFGLAKQLNNNSTNTRTGALLGTPSYVAPEQARGDVKEVGPAADIYSLGAILYELMVGRPPFLGTTYLDTVMQVLRDDPVAPTRLVPQIPIDLETICLKCLQKDPGRRYRSADELAEDCRLFQAGEPILSRPISQWERMVSWSRRNPRLASLMATVVALVMLVVVGSLAAAYVINGERQE